jgi:hypothetical protein
MLHISSNRGTIRPSMHIFTSSCDLAVHCPAQRCLSNPSHCFPSFFVSPRPWALLSDPRLVSLWSRHTHACDCTVCTLHRPSHLPVQTSLISWAPLTSSGLKYITELMNQLAVPFQLMVLPSAVLALARPFCLALERREIWESAQLTSLSFLSWCHSWNHIQSRLPCFVGTVEMDQVGPGS